MGICGNNESNPEEGGKGGPISAPKVAEKLVVAEKLRVFGHHFNTDTRTVLTLLKISGISYTFNEVDVFQGKHKEIEFLRQNPTGQIPMVLDQDCQLVGSVDIFVRYLVHTKPRLQSYMPREHAAKVDQYLNWHQTVLHPCVQRLIKVTVGPKAFGVEDFTGEEVEAAKNAFFQDILKRINEMLSTQKFLISSNEVTVVDIIFYNELSTALMLTRVKGFKRQFPNVGKWIELMNETPELNDMDEKLVEAIEKYGLE